MPISQHRLNLPSSSTSAESQLRSPSSALALLSHPQCSLLSVDAKGAVASSVPLRRLLLAMLAFLELAAQDGRRLAVSSAPDGLQALYRLLQLVFELSSSSSGKKDSGLSLLLPMLRLLALNLKQAASKKSDCDELVAECTGTLSPLSFSLVFF